MKNANRIVVLLSFILLSSISAAQASEPINQDAIVATTPQDLPDSQGEQTLDESTLTPELKAQLAKELDTMVTQIIAQTGRIELVLEDLSLCINTGSIGKENKKSLLTQIKELRTLINSVKSSAFVEVDPSTLLFLISFNDAVIEHIALAIKKGLTSIPPFDPATLQKRMEAISLDQLENNIVKNEEHLEKLKQASQDIGLSWFNKTFRKFTSFLIVAHHKGWDSTLFKASLTAAVVTHYLAMYTEIGFSVLDDLETKAYRLQIKRSKARTEAERKLIEDDQANVSAEINMLKANGSPDKGGFIHWFTSKFRWCVGMRPIIHDEQIINSTQVGKIGHLDTTIREVAGTFSYAYLPIIAALYGTSWPSDIGSWIGKRIAWVYGKLQGGVAAQQAENQIEEDQSQEPKYTFDDVVGLDHIKVTLNKVLEYIKNPERFDRAQIPPERGYLFTGLPGSGKSFVAEAFGGEIRKALKESGRSKDELGWYSFSAEFINKKGIGWLMDLAKKESPCVIFIDEIDLLNLQRGGNSNSVLLSEFLCSMSGVLSKEAGKQVILLAATNRPEHLDKALRRRGRFGKVIHFELPTLAERKTFFVKKLSPLLPDMNQVNVDRLAEQTEGRTYEELTAMTNAAFQNTKISGQPLTQAHLEHCLDEEIRNIIHKDMHVSEQEQELIAAHQAGHAMARALLKTRQELAAVTIKPINVELQDEAAHAQYYGPRKQKDILYGNTFTKCSFDHLEIFTRDEKIKECKILLAGMIAERIILGACGHSYHTNDKQEALDLVKSLVFEGLHPQTMPKELQLKYFEKALEELKQYEVETEALLMQHKAALQGIAHDLVEFKTLSERDVKAILEKNGSLPSSSVAVPA